MYTPDKNVNFERCDYHRSKNCWRSKQFPNFKTCSICVNCLFYDFFDCFSEIETINHNKDFNICLLCILKDNRLVSYLKSKTWHDNRIVIYERYNFEENEICLFNKSLNASSLCGLKNGNLAASIQNNIFIWEINGKKNKQIYRIEGHNEIIKKVIELEDGKLCSCSDDKTIRIWDNNNQYKCSKIIKDSYYVQSILEINNYIISLHSHFQTSDQKNQCNSVIKIWDKSKYECVKEIDYTSSYFALSKLGEDKVFIGGNNELYILDILSFQFKSIKDNRLGLISSICVLENNGILLGNDKGIIICFDSSFNQIICTKKLYFNCLSCIIENEYYVFTCSLFSHEIDVYTYTNKRTKERINKLIEKERINKLIEEVKEVGDFVVIPFLFWISPFSILLLIGFRTKKVRKILKIIVGVLFYSVSPLLCICDIIIDILKQYLKQYLDDKM